MSAAWNERFSTWAQSPSTTETEKIQHAITAVQKALSADSKLSKCTKVFVQGSYRNRVNVRQDSDVDIGVLYTGSVFFADYPDGKQKSDFGNLDSAYTYSNFKNDLGTALTNHFQSRHVTRGDKAFDIHENSYRVDADVVPLFESRRYKFDGSYICGTALSPDSGGFIRNYPERLFDTPQWREQHYENGKNKNEATDRAYRGVVRIIKKLRNVMADEGIAEAIPVKGFEVECLVWNAPNQNFANTSWFGDVSDVLNFLSFHTASLVTCGEWGEVSELKYLVKNNDAKRARLEAFVNRAKKYVGI